MNATPTNIAIAIAPTAPHVVPPLGGPSSLPPLPSVQSASASSAKSAVTAAAPGVEIELIIEHGVYVAMIIPRQVTQAQLLIAEHILPRGDLRCCRNLAEEWNVWRVYAKTMWAQSAICNPQLARPTGPKLFFA